MRRFTKLTMITREVYKTKAAGLYARSWCQKPNRARSDSGVATCLRVCFVANEDSIFPHPRVS